MNKINKGKNKVLFIMHMPPPVHGAAMMGQYIHDSKLINEFLNADISIRLLPHL